MIKHKRMIKHKQETSFFSFSDSSTTNINNDMYLPDLTWAISELTNKTMKKKKSSNFLNTSSRCFSCDACKRYYEYHFDRIRNEVICQ